jgi:hypothetical protein
MLNSNKLNSNISNMIIGALFGVGLSFLFRKLKNYLVNKNSLSAKESSTDIQIPPRSNEEEKILVREQLKRNYEFFGDNGMKLIENSFACVVGIGGVGR